MSGRPHERAGPADQRRTATRSRRRAAAAGATRCCAGRAILVILLVAGHRRATRCVSPYFLDVYNLADATYNFSEKAIIALGDGAADPGARDRPVGRRDHRAGLARASAIAAEAGCGPPVLIARRHRRSGSLCGAFNGFLVTAFGLPSIVVTIGTMSLFRGIAQVMLGDQALTTYPAGLPRPRPELSSIETPPLLSRPFVLLPRAGRALRRRPAQDGDWGRRLFAIGSNPVAARFSGIPVDRLRFCSSSLSGMLAGLAAALLTARIGSMRPNIALGWELDIVTMVILGGVSIAGGVGTILGVVLAVFVLGLATFGLSLINVPGIVINVMLGLLLIAAIALPIVARRSSARRG